MEQRSYGFTVSDIRAALPSYPGMVTSSDCSGDVLEEHRPEPSAANSMGKQHPYHSAPPHFKYSLMAMLFGEEHKQAFKMKILKL